MDRALLVKEIFAENIARLHMNDKNAGSLTKTLFNIWTVCSYVGIA